MKYLKEFCISIEKAIWPVILANPLSFLGVTGIVAIAILYDENRVMGYTFEDILCWFIVYIIMLYVFMNKRPFNSNDTESNKKDIIEIKQNNIGIFNIFKNTKK